jgi:mono/diheme cytochrome c family protein
MMRKASLTGLVVSALLLGAAGADAGPKPSKGNDPAKPAPAATAIDGGKLFQVNCSACHQANGRGVPGQFPPLAGNADLFLSRAFPANVVLFGLQGEIKTEGKTVASVMPPVAYLSDAEIAAVLHYVRTAWGNDKLRPPGFKPLDAAAVAGVRKHPLAPDQVRELRAKLRAGAK